VNNLSEQEYKSENEQEMGKNKNEGMQREELKEGFAVPGEAGAHAEEDKLAKLQEENVELFSRLQRLQADFDNYRKRVKAEKQEWNLQALADLVRELLPVLDNLERARDAEGTAESLLEGVDLVYKQFLMILEKQGLSKIEACGTQFDPHCHHAIMQVECEEPENTVVEEMQKGYRFKDRVIRASMVKVAN
jgi:molecular chaperone GrpE